MFEGKSLNIFGIFPVFLTPSHRCLSNPPGRDELLAWFESNLPAVIIEPLAPSERSDFLCGGVDGRIRIDFDAESLAVFAHQWEDKNGKSVDTRWQRYCWTYESWLETDGSDHPPDIDL